MKGESSFMLTKDDNLKAVYSTELDDLLKKLNILNEFSQGLLKCRYCSNIITKDNLYAVVPIDSSIEFCCNRPDCVLSLTWEAKK